MAKASLASLVEKTICVKNFVGATHFRQRPYFVDSRHWEEVVSEINLACSPDLNIVDGTKIMVSVGPRQGQEKDTNLILASGDRVAADIVGLGVIKSFGLAKKIAEKNVWQQRQIKRAVELSLGAKNAGEMKLLLKSLDGSREFAALMEKSKRLYCVRAVCNKRSTVAREKSSSLSPHNMMPQ